MSDLFDDLIRNGPFVPPLLILQSHVNMLVEKKNALILTLTLLIPLYPSCYLFFHYYDVI